MRVSWVDVQLGNFVIGKYDNSLIDVINFLIYLRNLGENSSPVYKWSNWKKNGFNLKYK